MDASQRQAADAVVARAATARRCRARSRRRAPSRRRPARVRARARVRHAAPLGHARGARARARAQAARATRGSSRSSRSRSTSSSTCARAAFAVVDRAVDGGRRRRAPAGEGRSSTRCCAVSCASATRWSSGVMREPVARWSHPRWWIARVRADWPRRLGAILAAGNERPPLTLRVNARVASRDALLRALRRRRASRASAVGASGIIVAPPRPVRELPGFDEGAFSVQDAGAQLAAPILDATRRRARARRVRGARRQDDAHPRARRRRARPRSTAMRRGSRASARTSRGSSLAGPHVRRRRRRCVARRRRGGTAAPFDRILADVPCTASGIVRRHPDGKWLRRASDVAAFAAAQRALLDALWGCARAGRDAALRDVLGVRRGKRGAGGRIRWPGHPMRCAKASPTRPRSTHRGGQLLPSLPGGSPQSGRLLLRAFRKA